MTEEVMRVDMRIPDPEGMKEGRRCSRLIFKINQTMPMTEEYMSLLKELFGDNLGEGSCVVAPFSGACVSSVRIGRDVFINSNALFMARGGITIGDGAQIAANVQLISNNHDPYDLKVLTCKPVVIGEQAWIGAGATILPGVRVGKHAVIGAAAVVTKDVPDYGVAVGNPARVIKMLDRRRFSDGPKYRFWGWEHADAAAVTDEYKGIRTPIDLYDALSHIWCADTCAPRMRADWTEENRTLGQCSITAFLAQDIFGGKVYGILRPGGNYHCYNVIGDCRFDLTSEQFGDTVLDYENNPEQLREVHFAKEEKRLRYEYLRAELKKYCDGISW